MNAPTPAIRQTMSARDWAQLVLLSVLWGGSFFFAKVAVTEIPPMTLVLGRVAIAALLLALVLRLRGVALPKEARVWGAFLVMGLLNNALPFTLIFWGQTHIASGLASIINATTPLFTILVASRFTQDERLTTRRLAGVLIGFAGVAGLIGPALGGSGISGSLAGELACLGAAISYGFAAVFGRRFARMGVAPMSVAFGQMTGSSLIMLPMAALVDGFWQLPMPGAVPLGALAALAVASTAFAYLLFFRLLASAGATNVALVTLLVPVSAILLGAIFLGERLSPAQFGGMAAIAAGLITIDGRLLSRLYKGRRQGRGAA